MKNGAVKPSIATKCPSCGFRFNTGENLIPKFKIGERVLFNKSTFHDFGYKNCRKNFDFLGTIYSYSLCRAGNHANTRAAKKDCWMYTVEYLPYSKRNGLASNTFFEYQLKKINNKQS